MKFKRKMLCGMVAAALGMACLAGCSSSGTEGDATLDTQDTSGGVAATVNGVEIGENAVTAYVASYREAQGLEEDDDWGTWLIENGYTMDSLRAETIDYYVNRELIAQAAEDLGIEEDTEEIDAQVQQARDLFDSDEEYQEALAGIGMSSEDAYRAYIRLAVLEEQIIQEVAADVTVSDEDLLEQVATYAPLYDGAKRVSVIQFDAGDAETAQEVLDAINAGELDFAEAAGQYSLDDSASDGGDLGWDKLQSIALADEIQDTLDGLAAGEVSGVVEASDAVYLVMCTDVLESPDEVTSLDQVSEGFVETIRESADQQAKEDAFSNYMTEFKENAEIVVNDMPDGLPYVIDLTPYEEAAYGDSDDADDEGDADDVEESGDAEEDSSSE